GEPLGTTPAAAIAHLGAIALVIACVRPLAGAQQRLVDREPETATDEPVTISIGAVLRAISGLAFAGVVLVAGSLVTMGLVYQLRELNWLAVGPRVPDALPLLQLAGFDSQPAARVIVGGLLAGAVVGLAMIRLERWRRFVIVALLAAVLLLLGSDASYALARNLRWGPVLLDRTPPVGPWLEALVVAAGCVLPGRLNSLALRAFVPRVLAISINRPARRVLAPALAAAAGIGIAGALVLPTVHAGAETRAQAAEQAALAPALPAGPPRSAPRSLRAYSKAATGRLVTVYFYSEALHRKADYLVYVPPQYRPTRPLPVVYLLHGMPGRPLAFTVNARVESKLQNLIHAHLASPMILVFPDGRVAGNTQSDSEWANTHSGQFENYVVNVVHDVDRRFATLPCRGDRAIAGLSAGAYGAANIGLHQVALFSVIQMWSGYFIETRAGVFEHGSRSQLAYNSPLDYVWTMENELHRYPLQTFLYVGTGDSDRGQMGRMAAALRAVGARVQYAIYPGGHNWGLWTPRMDQMLVIASHDFGNRTTRCASPGSSGARSRGTARLAAKARSSPTRNRHHRRPLKTARPALRRPAARAALRRPSRNG
ncbi:MAG: hypothetical protein JO304_24680, partial [Solirubrobacterales bacterium]|nr:hypothetical protein [Solirubrobacterales bacterium]